jgi:hypothetical protein
VEVVKGAAAPPAPGTEAWWRAAVRETVYALRHRGLVQYVGEVVSWTGLLKKVVFISSSGLTHLTRLQSKPSLTPRCISQPSLVYRRRLLHIDVLNAHVDGWRTPSSPPPTRNPPAPALFTPLRRPLLRLTPIASSPPPLCLPSSAALAVF